MATTKPCITIVGTGLLGSSMGMAILKSRGNEIDVLGHDIEFAQARLAQRMGALSRVERNLIAACSKADLLILAIPASAIRETLQLVAGDLKSGCVVHDVASVKVSVLETADELLPDDVSYVGGDPVLFGDEAGIESARADLLQGVYYTLTPSMKASPESVKLVTDLVAMLGARPHFIDPHEHDGLIGGTEHLADVVAVSMLASLTKSNGWRDMRKMCGATFDRVTCFSQMNASEYSSRATQNKANILRWIDNLQREMSELRRLIDTDDAEAIERYYQREMDERLQWLQDRDAGDWGDMPEKTDIPTAGEFTSQMLFGGLAGRRDRD